MAAHAWDRVLPETLIPYDVVTIRHSFGGFTQGIVERVYTSETGKVTLYLSGSEPNHGYDVAQGDVTWWRNALGMTRNGV